NALIEQGKIVRLAGDILFLREKYADAIVQLMDYMREYGSMTVSQARDVLGMTRKYIVPLLEHMDTLRLTCRQGDVRLLGSLAYPLYYTCKQGLMKPFEKGTES